MLQAIRHAWGRREHEEPALDWNRLERLLYPPRSAQTGRRKGDDLVLPGDRRETADHPAQVVADSGPRK